MQLTVRTNLTARKKSSRERWIMKPDDDKDAGDIENYLE